MRFFNEWGRFLMAGATAHAKWEINISNTILHDRKRLILLALLLTMTGSLYNTWRLATVAPAEAIR